MQNIQREVSAKEIEVRPVEKKYADRVIRRVHYSGKVVNNSQLNFGVFLDNRLLGAMQFGPPTDKRKLIGLVKGTEWNGFLELNRLAFDEKLPKFSETRALSLAFKWIKKNAPHIKWILSFADGCQCGHGTIYQAANFKLTAIKKNKSIIILPNGDRTNDISINSVSDKYGREKVAKGYSSTKKFLDSEYPRWKPLDGFMLRYIYFIDKKEEKNFTGRFIPFSKIKEVGAEMYRGQKVG